MLEPLSEPIRNLLLELKLCSEKDLRRCRRHVRRLTCDLPAFDSVWIDALVQIGCLTPFQARMLESPHRCALQIGPCIAIERLGGGTSHETYLARVRDGRELRVAKIVRSASQLSAESIERLLQLVERLRGFEHPSVVAPSACVRTEDQLVLVSRYVAGPCLSDLLIRRGRFPASVVWEIGGQLAGGLDALALRGIAHGDVRLANVRLLASGTAVLVDAGISPAIDPSPTIHAGLAPERCDGVAPELIGGNAAPNLGSDAYALGCLLWHLLAGRPPFPGGDPLVKLAAHQTRAIDDVRKWAPDTPPELATGIRRMTARPASERPASLSEVFEAWQASGRGRSTLAGFRRRFDAPAPVPRTGERLSTPTRWLLMLAALFALCGAGVTLADRGARTVVLAWAMQLSQQIRSEISEREEIKSRFPASVGDRLTTLDAEAAAPAGRALPAPDRHGVIRLDAEGGSWRSSEITAVGDLTIAGDEGALSRIIVDDRPLRLCAERVRLSNIRIDVAPDGARQAPRRSALVLVQAQELVIEGCVFDAGPVSPGAAANPGDPVIAPPTGPALIAWKLLDASEKRGRTAAIRNTVLRGDGPGLYLADAVRHVAFENVLKLGASPLVQLAAVPADKSATLLKLVHSTCRGSGALLRWVVPAEGSFAGRVEIDAGDCVFDLVSPRAALCEFAGTRPRLEWLRQVRLTGEGSIASPMLDVAAWISTEDGRVTALDGAAVEVEGIFSGPFRFVGEPGANPVDSEVEECEAPRRTSDPPGIRAGSLPGK